MKYLMGYAFFAFVMWVPFAAVVAESPNSDDAYRRICEAYLSGRWDELEKALKVPADTLSALTAEQRADVAYARKSLAECRPEWWKLCKTSEQKVPLRPVVFGQACSVTYDPAGKQSVQMQVISGVKSLTVSWPAAEMDNPAHAEHGFSKGDLNHLGVWATLGMARAWNQTPLESLVNLSEADKLQLLRYQDFRGNLTGLYYGTPTARRWGEFLYLLAWMDKYAKMPIVGCRKAAGAMFLAEIMADPDKYPSLPLPKSLPAEGAEKELAEHFRARIEKQGWTVAEDRCLRAAIKAFATANDASVYRTGKATFANRLTVSLDPEADAPFRAKRDAWLKAQFDKANTKQ